MGHVDMGEGEDGTGRYGGREIMGQVDMGGRRAWDR